MSHGWARKLGLVATEPNATLVFAVTNITQPIRVLNFVTLKSYGPKWEGSRARFSLWVDDAQVWQTFIEGTHESKSSISYSHEFVLDNAVAVGSNIRLMVQLVGGKTFKVMGMMLCRR